MSNSNDAFHFVAEILGCEVDSLSVDSGYLKHPDWDSLGHLNILLALEERFGIAPDERAAERFITMRSIIELFQSQNEGKA